ncbi:C1 family peptidase, partial [Salmonella enterica]|nr:C1 family peptidase [Salmonella enterica]
SEIYSPSDIWRGISSSAKNTKCEGPSFQPAVNAMISRGVATWATSPYFSSVADCDCAASSSANTDAAKHKIKSYREIKVNDVNTVKRYLAEGHPVVIGACLGDNFMSATSSSVIYSKGTTNLTGMHAYHAMLCVGYDNNRGGSNGAFRIVNSWGETWGDNGFVWLDADYMCSTGFAYTGLVAYIDGDDTTSYGDTSSDVDLQPTTVTDADFSDASDADADDPRWRTLTYDVYNAGQGTVYASSTWGNAYVLYNAYNANEMTVVLVDLYTDQLGIGKNEVNYNWDATEAKATIGLAAQGYSLTNVDIPGECSVATYVTKATDDDATADAYYFSWSYKLPDVTGSYYLVMIADAFSSVSE